MEREKITCSGPLLEADFYPVRADGRRVSVRAPKSKPSTAEQIRYNHLIAAKKIVRIVNENFDSSDYLMTITYTPARAPQSEREARRDIGNFFRRMRTRRASELKRLLTERAEAKSALKKMPDNSFIAAAVKEIEARISKLKVPLKYAYTIEKEVYKRGRYAGRANWHFHLFVTGCIPERTLENMWGIGIRVNCNRFQPDRFGPEAAALYMSKDPCGSKRFVCSRNMQKPTVQTKDGIVTARTVERMAKERVDDRAYWEQRYKGYKFVRCYSRFNPYNGQWYVSVVMYRTDGVPPQWSADEWIATDYIECGRGDTATRAYIQRRAG